MVLLRVDPLMTLVVLAPLGVVIAHRRASSLRRVEAYRAASQEAIGDVTGLLGELFGAALAVKVGRRRGARRRPPGGDQRAAPPGALRDRVFTTSSHGDLPEHREPRHRLLLLAGAEAMRGGSFTVGDFALFVSYLGWLAQTTELGRHVPGPRPADGRLARTGCRR